MTTYEANRSGGGVLAEGVGGDEPAAKRRRCAVASDGVADWAGLVLATLIVLAALVLLLERILPLQPAEMAGMFFVGAAPGAPATGGSALDRGKPVCAATAGISAGAFFAGILDERGGVV